MNKKAMGFLAILGIIFLVTLVSAGTTALFIHFRGDYLGGKQVILNQTTIIQPVECRDLEGNVISCINPDDPNPILPPTPVKILNWCQKNQKKWGVIPYVPAYDKQDKKAICIDCADYLNNQGRYSYIPLQELKANKFVKYVSDLICINGLCTAEMVENELCDIWEKDECPPLFKIGNTEIPDYICELKLAVGKYFKPLIIGISVIVGLLVFFFFYTFAMQLKKKNRIVPIIIGIIVGGGLGYLIYKYFWVGIGVTIVVLIIRAMLPHLPFIQEMIIKRKR